MNKKITDYVDLLFSDVPETGKTRELRQEILADLSDHFEAHIAEGKSEDEAYALALDDMGDIQGLIASERQNFPDNREDSGTAGQSAENEFLPDGIKTVDLDLHSISVEITQSEDNFLHADFLSNSQTLCKIKNHDGEIRIHEKKRILPALPGAKIRLRIPCGHDIALKINNVSGKVKVSGLEAQALRLKTVSGGIQISGCRIARLNAESVSGGINADGFFGRIAAESVSGGIKIQTKCPLEEQSTFESVSGGIHLNMPGTSSYTLRWSSISGHFRDDICGVDGKKSGSSSNAGGTAQISARTVSGGIKVGAIA